jgi:hypothetical protein
LLIVPLKYLVGFVVATHTSTEINTMTLQELARTFNSWRQTLTVYRGALRRLRPVTVEYDATQHHERLKSENEAIRRLSGIESERIGHDIRREFEAERRLAAAAARYQAAGVREFCQFAGRLVEQTKRDTSITFPDALDRVTADGMIALALLRVQMLPLIRTMSPAQMLATYEAAIKRKDPRGLVEAEIIEQLAHSGEQLAQSEGDLPVAKQLRELINDVADLRLPSDTPDFDSLLAEVDRLDSRADLIRLLPSGADDAAAALDRMREETTEAGAAADAEDQAALRAELVS